MLSEEKIMEIVREASRGSATRRDGSTSVRIARAIESAVLAELAKQESVAEVIGAETPNTVRWMPGIDRAMRERLIGAKLYLHPAPAPEGMVKQCEWHHCGDEYMPGTWDGECGAKWTFTEDDPVENNVRFCPECGGEVVIAAAKKEQSK